MHTAFMPHKFVVHARYVLPIAGMVGLLLGVWLELRPSPAVFEYQRGRNLEAIGLMQQAQQAYIAAIRRDPRYPPPYRALAEMAMHENDNLAAIDFWHKYLKLLPTAKHAWCRLAEAEALVGLEVSAERDAQHELKLDTNCPRAHLCLGILAAKRNDALSAIQHLRVASQAYSKDPQIQLTYAKVLALTGNYNQAQQVLLSVLQLARIHPEPYYWLGYIYARRSVHPSSQHQAEQYLLQALLLNPHYPEANFELGRLYFNEHRLKAALPYLQKAIREKPHYIAALYTLAQVQLMLGDNKDATTTLAEYQRESMLQAEETSLLRRYSTDRQNVALLLQLGRLEIQRNEPKAALLFLRTADNLKPHDPEIQKALFQALSLQRKMQAHSGSSL
jgi:predicted Zn-dependent protease